MTLGELIAALEAMPPDHIAPIGFRNAHSWRGVYADVAFEPAPNVPVAEMLTTAKSALGTTYEGWKGGDFTMDDSTDVHLSFEGNSQDYWALVAVASPEIVKAKMRADDQWSFDSAFTPASEEAPE